MSSATSELIARGLHAWSTGDLDTLEAVFHPAVTLRTVAPGEWDCVGRDELMWLLRQRQAHTSSALPPLSVEVLDEQTVIVTSTPPRDAEGWQPFPVATHVTITDGKVVAMQQYRTDDSE